MGHQNLKKHYPYFNKKEFKKRDRKYKNKHHRPPRHIFTYFCQPTTHHLIPTSRGGTNDEKNRKQIPRLRHEAWHLLFKNLKPEEVIEIIKSKSMEEITDKRKSRILAWEIIFGYWETTVEEKIKIIKNFWMPKEG